MIEVIINNVKVINDLVTQPCAEVEFVCEEICVCKVGVVFAGTIYHIHLPHPSTTYSRH